MKEKSAPSSALRFALIIVIAHAAAVAVHSAAHQILGVEASPGQLVFIVIVIMLAPLVAGLLLWKRIKTAAGAMLLACSMAGSMLFGIYYHFIVISPDHVSHVGALPQKFWALIFQISAVLLALVEAVGMWAGMQALKKV